MELEGDLVAVRTLVGKSDRPVKPSKTQYNPVKPIRA